jgi:hypothetical protein
MKLIVVGSLREVPTRAELAGAFVEKLGERIIERGHTLLNGCRGSLDTAIAKAADARQRALGQQQKRQVVGYCLTDTEPAHRFGVVRISERKNWDLTLPDLIPPEQFSEADAAIFVAGNEGTFVGANWARIAGIPVLGVTAFGGAGKALYVSERTNLAKKFGHTITSDEFAVLNQDTDDVGALATEVVALAERMVMPHKVFPVLPFTLPFADVKDTIDVCCRNASLELEDIEREATTARIIPRILDGIRRAAFVVADVSEARPNVYFEIGLAYGMAKPIVLTAKAGTTLPFDLADMPVLFWDSQRSLRDQLTSRLLALAAKRVESTKDSP